MYEFSYYTFCHPEYFETLSRYRATPVYRDILLTLLPESWTLTRSDIWIHARSRSTRIESQGFKIHISASISQAESVLQRIVPVCVNAGASFKIVVDPTVHRFLNSKRFHRSGSGKFATIYSPSETSFRHMVEELRHATADLEGPYILSDRRYKDSKIVFYRYGGFESIPDLQADGTKQLMIRDQDGKLVPDQRQPYFDLPAWISDPFVESEPSAAGGADANGLLRDRYEVLEALNFTNTGGVYRAVDHTSGRMVVIKEARPHTLNWIRRDQTIDATAALSHEHACLQMLQGLSCVPEVIEFYQEWEHVFLVTSFREGLSLDRLRARDDFIVLTSLDRPERVKKFCVTWRHICIRVLETVKDIHAHGVILGDISPGNVVLNTETLDLTFIDLESALIVNDAEFADFNAQWFNPGFRSPSREAGQLKPTDDYYACGMLLYNLLCPIQTLFELDKAHPIARMLNYFIASGLPTEIQVIITTLWAGNIEEALQVARSWDPNEQVYVPQTMSAEDHLALIESL